MRCCFWHLQESRNVGHQQGFPSLKTEPAATKKLQNQRGAFIIQQNRANDQGQGLRQEPSLGRWSPVPMSLRL